MSPPPDERDPLPDRDWTPVSSAWARKQAVQAAAEAVRKSKERRSKPATQEDR